MPGKDQKMGTVGGVQRDKRMHRQAVNWISHLEDMKDMKLR